MPPSFPSDFKPTAPADFIGPAARVAAAMQRLVELTNETGRPSAQLFIGEPGTGKSSLCEYVVARLTGVPAELQRGHYKIHYHNGRKVNLETVADLAFTLQSRPMFGDWRVIWIDEVDQLTRDAQVLMLSLLDDLPKSRHTILLATSNEDFTGEGKERRFQSRMQMWPVGPPTADEIAALLTGRFGLGDLAARGIAACANGDVRAALRDADSLSLAA